MATSNNFSMLPCEIRKQIWSRCPRKDLKVLSLCCKWLYADVSPDLWKQVNIKWHRLDEKTNEIILKPHPNLHLISQLELLTDSIDDIRSQSKGYLFFGFVSFLRCCDPNRLRSLTIYDIEIAGGLSLLNADGLRLVCVMFPQLEVLDLTFMTGHDMKPFAHLSALESLKSLKLEACTVKMDSADSSSVGFAVKNLVDLDLRDTDLCEEFYSSIFDTSNKLESLTLISSNVTDNDLRNLKHLLTLKYLHLYDSRQITDLTISYISHLPLLENLAVHCLHPSPNCLKAIGKIKTLTYLSLSFEKSPCDGDISHLSNLQALNDLSLLDMGKLTDGALRFVSQLKLLEMLDLSGNNNFTDEGLRHLAQLPRLKRLTVNRNEAFSDKGLTALRR